MKYIFIPLIFISVSLIAQTNDYYITVGGDTVTGNILLKKRMTNFFDFEANGVQTRITSREASRFYASGSHYFFSTTKYGDLCFKEELVGFSNLSSGYYESEKLYLLTRMDGEELLLTKNLSKQSDLEYISTLGGIKNFFDDCGIVNEDNIKSGITVHKEIKDKMLYDLVNNLNTCKDPAYKKRTPPKRGLQYSLGIYVGADNSKVDVERGYFFKESGISGSSAISIFPELRLNATSFNGKFNAFLAGSYKSFNYSSSSSRSQSAYDETYNSVIDYNAIEFSLGLQYNIKVFKKVYIAPIISGTMRNLNVKKMESNVIQYYPNDSEVIIQQNPVIDGAVLG